MSLINHKTVWGLVLTLLVIASGARAQQEEAVGADEVVRVNTTLISVPVTVSDRNGRYVPNLKAEDFTLWQDGVKQDIGFFAAEEEPLSVALLLDTSRSTSGVLDKIKDAAKDFIKLLQPADRSMIVSFDYSVHVLSPLTADRKTLERAVNNAEIGEYVGTVMQDAVWQTVERSLAGVKGRKAVILLTDGKDFGSDQAKAELLYRLEESDVLIYSVFYQTDPADGMQRRGGLGRMGRRRGGIFGDNFPARFPNSERRRARIERADAEATDFLEELSAVTAGRFYRKDVTDLKQTFTLIADELRRQYRLGYYPRDAQPDGTVHNLRVKVARPDVAVRARNTYRAKQP